MTNQTVHLEVDYYTAAITAVELPCTWDDVKEWWVKWNTLFVHLNDGTEHEFELSYETQIEMKRPHAVTVWPDVDGGPVFDNPIAEHS